MVKLSFVIPAYNEEHYIGTCLEAIIRETKGRNDVEIIVADNNSTDRTAEVAKQFPGVTVVRETRRGANAARKTGFEASHGELVAFPDADSVLVPGWVTRAEKEFADDKNLACVSGPFIYYDLPKRVQLLVRIFYLFAYGEYLFGRLFLQKATMIQGGNYMARRTALEAIGGQDANITFYGDDTDLAIRLSKVGVVKFSFKMPILTSGRRLAKEGVWMMGFRYALNNFWMLVFRRPWTMSAKEVRFGAEGTVYKPDERWKEWLVASIFFLVILVFLGIVIYIVHWIVTAA